MPIHVARVAGVGHRAEHRRYGQKLVLGGIPCLAMVVVGMGMIGRAVLIKVDVINRSSWTVMNHKIFIS